MEVRGGMLRKGFTCKCILNEERTAVQKTSQDVSARPWMKSGGFPVDGLVENAKDGVVVPR
jgi:hypothetical protein